MVNNNRLDQLALHCIPGIGSVTIRQLISHFGSASGVWQARKRNILAVRGIGPFTTELLREGRKYRSVAEDIATTCERLDIQVIFHTDPGFPARLKHIPDAPSILYFHGNADLNSERIIGVVGTRNCTSYGESFVINLIDELKDYKIIIISGLAYGIDIQAHRAAIRSGIPTLGVMAGGADWIYPAVHRREAQKMIEDGGILSEHPPGTRPEAHHFPSRNRIIAGMCDAVIVAEAGPSGGAQITARLANDYNREVFAVPGSVRSYASIGCHNLIKRNQAHLLTSAADLVEIMNWDQEVKIRKQPENLSVAEQRIMAVLNDFPEGLQLDRLTWAANLTVAEAAIALLGLECRQLVRSLPGNIYKLT